MNKHSYFSCYRPHSFPPNVNVHGHGTCECNGRMNTHSLLLAAAGILAWTLKLGERGLNFQNTGDIEMSVYLSDTGISNVISSMSSSMSMSSMSISIYIYIYMSAAIADTIPDIETSSSVESWMNIYIYIYIYVYIYYIYVFVCAAVAAPGHRLGGGAQSKYMF